MHIGYYDRIAVNNLGQCDIPPNARVASSTFSLLNCQSKIVFSRLPARPGTWLIQGAGPPASMSKTLKPACIDIFDEYTSFFTNETYRVYLYEM